MFSFYSWIMLHCVCAPHSVLSTLLLFEVLPPSGYGELCCSQQWKEVLCLSILHGLGYVGHMISPYSTFLREPHTGSSDTAPSHILTGRVRDHTLMARLQTAEGRGRWPCAFSTCSLSVFPSWCENIIAEHSRPRRWTPSQETEAGLSPPGSYSHMRVWTLQTPLDSAACGHLVLFPVSFSAKYK